MNNLEIICSRLTLGELLAQLAEEAAELGHAALKLRRVLEGNNPTPVTYDQARASLCEEIGDVDNALQVIDEYLKLNLTELEVLQEEKMDRWAERLMAQKTIHVKSGAWARRWYGEALSSAKKNTKKKGRR